MYTFSRDILRFYLRIVSKLKVIGQENIPMTGGFILAANHRSYLDPPVVGSACPRSIAFMAKEELFTTSFLKAWIKAVGCISVKHGISDRQAIERAVLLLKQGECVSIFPEGMRVPPGMVKEGEAGIAWVADLARVPIVPMGILGTQPWSRKIFGIIPWPSKIEVRIGKPLKFDFNYDPKHRKEYYKKVVDDVMENIRALLS